MRPSQQSALLGIATRAMACASALVAALPARADAQQPTPLPTIRVESNAPPPAGPRTIVGIVADTGDAPIDSVEVTIVSLQRRTFTDVKGAFRFNDVRPGDYELRARRIGFAPQIRRLTLDKQLGGSTRFTLLPVPQLLRPVVTSASRGGLSGVVGDTAYHALTGATVTALGTPLQTTTDSAGLFFLDAKPGKYMLRVTNPGYDQRLASVTVPRDSGRQVFVWLAPAADRRRANRDAAVTWAMQERFIRKSAMASFYTREDMDRLRVSELGQVAQMGSGTPVSDDCMAVIDGVRSLPVYALATDDLESVEVYPPGSLSLANDGRISRTRPPTSINQNRPINPQRSSRQTAGRYQCPMVYAWTRR